LLRAKEIADSIYAEAIADEKQRAEVLRHASRSGTAKSIQAMVQLASCDPSVIVLPEDMDRHPMRLNCENGTLDLTTGRLHDHNRNEMITHCLPVKFDNEATCAHWLAFLDRIFAGNDAVIDFVQRAIGYSLTADTREQCLFFLHGDGQNGKSTFINLLLELLDTYALRTPTETLMTRRNEGVPNDIAALDGPRFVTASEVSEHQRLNEPRIKDLTGGDRISARFMRGEFFNFTPVFKLWLSGNHKPRITGTDSGIWRRIRLIPFEVTIPDADIDRDLPKKLRAELPGILRWAVEGCLNVQNDGLRVPESVTSATENYRKEMDTIGDFIAECCVTGPDFRIKASVLYQAYSEWCKESGYQALNLTNFGLNISKRGYEKKKITAGVHYLEISLNA
jgi:putative DNA primase/helicase